MALLLVSPPDALPAFLREAAAAPFAFGQWDCSMLLANWVWRVTGVDPAPNLRGAYATAFGWRRRVVRSGGLDILVGHLAAHAGMRPTDNPRPGDIAVVDTAIGMAGAIRGGSRWVTKTGHGVTAAAFQPRMMWTF